MEYEFHFQDPTMPNTVYLFEAIIEALTDADSWRGLFSFASCGGVDALFLDQTVANFLERGDFSLIVGIDAITNRPTLERLLEFERQYPRLAARVFWNATTGLFHPKISHFRYGDGRQTVIVGSGNLTPGGLRENLEAYSVCRVNRRERLDLSSLEAFLNGHAADIRPIDDEALERAARNIARGGRRHLRDVEPVAEEAEREGASTRTLVAQIPRAGGRWHQAHFNEVVIDRFFRIQPNSAQRVFLRERRPDGSLGPQEVRPLVLSGTNKNRKIELAARAGTDYPVGDNPPVAVFRELQLRTFEYLLLMPGDEGYEEMLRFTQSRPSVGSGKPRVISDVATIRRVWPACPLV